MSLYGEPKQIPIHTDGTAAVVYWEDDSYSHDSGYFTFTIYVKFNDPNLNPPHAEAWIADTMVVWHKDFTEEMALKSAEDFYQFMMSFRTVYDKEDTINFWRNMFEDARDMAESNNRLLMQAQNNIDIKDRRINELETDYVKSLETEIATLRNIIGDACVEIGNLKNDILNKIR